MTILITDNHCKKAKNIIRNSNYDINAIFANTNLIGFIIFIKMLLTKDIQETYQR